MRRHLKTLLTLTLIAALLASYLPAALMEGAAGSRVQLAWTRMGATPVTMWSSSTETWGARAICPPG